MQILKGVHTKICAMVVNIAIQFWLGFVALRVPIEGCHILLATKYSSEIKERIDINT
jgi:hypothetical protein